MRSGDLFHIDAARVGTSRKRTVSTGTFLAPCLTSPKAESFRLFECCTTVSYTRLGNRSRDTQNIPLLSHSIVEPSRSTSTSCFSVRNFPTALLQKPQNRLPFAPSSTPAPPFLATLPSNWEIFCSSPIFLAMSPDLVCSR